VLDCAFRAGAAETIAARQRGATNNKERRRCIGMIPRENDFRREY
jgi:hypothetical protein